MNPTNDTTKPPSRTELREYDVIVPTADGKNIAYKVPLMVPMEWDDTIDSWLLTPDAMLEIENTKARHMGLLLPEEIKALREKLGLTQQQVADMSGIALRHYQKFETGERIFTNASFYIVMKIADTLDVHIDELVKGGPTSFQWKNKK